MNKVYLLVGEDGDVVRKAELSQEDLCNFDQSTVTNILELEVLMPEGNLAVKQLQSVDSEEIAEDDEETDNYEGTKYTAADWNIVA